MKGKLYLYGQVTPQQAVNITLWRQLGYIVECYHDAVQYIAPNHSLIRQETACAMQADALLLTPETSVRDAFHSVFFAHRLGLCVVRPNQLPVKGCDWLYMEALNLGTFKAEKLTQTAIKVALNQILLKCAKRLQLLEARANKRLAPWLTNGRKQSRNAMANGQGRQPNPVAERPHPTK